MARLLPVVGLGLVLFALAGCQTGSTLPIVAVPGVASASPIILDADASASGYHVAWASDDQGIQYMRLDRETMTWSPTRLIE